MAFCRHGFMSAGFSQITRDAHLELASCWSPAATFSTLQSKAKSRKLDVNISITC